MTKKTINATFKKLENDSGLRSLIAIKQYDNKNPSSQSLITLLTHKDCSGQAREHFLPRKTKLVRQIP